MNYSKALVESLEAAQLLAGHFATDYLESWQVLMALANNPYSVAGSALNEFPIEVDKLEEAAFDITGKRVVLTYCLSLTVWRSSLLKQGRLRKPSMLKA